MAWTGGQSRSPKEILLTLSSSPLLHFVRVDSEHVETAGWEQDGATEMEWGKTTGTRQDETIRTGWDETTRTGRDETTGTGQDETTGMGRDETSGMGRDGAGWDIDEGVR